MPTAVNPTVTPSQAEQLIRVSSAIASDLIKAHETGQAVSLNEIRNKWSKKFNYGGVPRLVDIISAVPDEYKKALLPKLKARPIRTASGVGGSFLALGGIQTLTRPIPVLDSCRSCHVQAASVPSHCYDGQHLRVLPWRT